MTSKQYFNVTQIFPHLSLNNGIEESRTGYEDINLLRPEVIITFNLLSNCQISLLRIFLGIRTLDDID